MGQGDQASADHPGQYMTAFAPPPPVDPAFAQLPAVDPHVQATAEMLAPPPDPLTIPPPPVDVTQPAPPAVDPFLAEAIVAVIGIEPFVSTEKLKKVHLYHLDRAAKMDDEIDRKLYQFIGSTEREKGADLPPFDFLQVRQWLETVPLPEHTAQIIGAFGEQPDLGLAAQQVAERIQAYLVSKVPHRVHQSIAGATQEMPGHSDVARFRRLWAIACDPLTMILDALNEYGLSRDMARALKEMFPLVWKRVDDGVTSQLGRKKTVTPKFRLPVRKEQQLRILVQKEDALSKALGVALQAQFAKEAAEQAPKPPRAKAKGSASRESSAADRIGMD